MEIKSILKRINNTIFSVARYTEVMISIIITVVIITLIIDLVYSLTKIPLFDIGSDYFIKFLASSLNLVVGIEFVKMLCKHTPETLVEVLMFATARQMVVEHLKTWETLVGVISIAILFTIRKFLFLKTVESEKLEDKF